MHIIKNVFIFAAKNINIINYDVAIFMPRLPIATKSKKSELQEMQHGSFRTLQLAGFSLYAAGRPGFYPEIYKKQRQSERYGQTIEFELPYCA